MIRLVVLATLCSIYSRAVTAQDLSYGLRGNDLSTHPMRPLSKPDLYETVIDTSFGTTIRRITNAPAGGVIKTMYSTVQAWNADESLILLYNQAEGVHILLDGNDYSFMRNLNDVSPTDIEDLFWHFTDPNLLLYVENSSGHLIEYNAFTGDKNIKADLPFLANCSDGIFLGNDIQMPSWNSSKIGFRCGNSKTFIYDILLESLTEVMVMDVQKTAAMPMPSGDLIFHTGSIYDSNGVFLRDLNVASVEHSCIGMDSNGDDFYFAISFAEGPEGGCLGDIIAHNATDGTCTELIGTGIGYAYPQSGVHLTSLAHKNTEGGWMAASMMGHVRDGQNLLDQELVIVKADIAAPKVYRIGHHRTSQANYGYWGEPHPCMSPSGTRVLFSSDWSDEEDGVSVDVYVVELPIHALTTSLNTEIILEEDGISIHPNPFSDYLYLELQTGNYSARIIDVNGVVYSALNLQEKNSLDLRTLPSGLYFLEIIKDNGQSICFRKIIKQ